MPGNIRKRQGKNGVRYMARIDLGRGIDGKRIQKTKSFRRKADAENWLLETARTHRRGEYVEPSQETVDQLIQRWMDSRTDLSEATLRSYEQTYRRYGRPHLGHLPISQVNARLIEETYNLQRGTSHPRFLHAVLSQAFRSAQRQRLISHNPCEAVTVPKLHSSDDDAAVEVWSADELRRFLEELERSEPYYYPVFAVLAATGMRPGEALALDWEDISLPERLIRVNATVSYGRKGKSIVLRPKRSSSRRQIGIDRHTTAILADHWQDMKRVRALRPDFGVVQGRELVFPSATGKLQTNTMLQIVMKRAIARAGVPYLSPHGLRHTHASLLLAARRPPHYVQRRLGHSSAMTTFGHYAHLIPLTDHQDADTYAELIETAREQMVSRAENESSV